jgi:hypothetical protein
MVAKLPELGRLHEVLTKEVRWVTMVINCMQSYLRMLIMVQGGVVMVDMRYYLGKI